MKRMLRSIVRKFGYDLISFNTYRGLPEPIIPWESETDFLNLYEIVHAYTLLDKRRLYMLYSAVKVASILEGDMAEVGVYKGGQLYSLVSCLMIRKIYTYLIRLKVCLTPQTLRLIFTSVGIFMIPL